MVQLVSTFFLHVSSIRHEDVTETESDPVLHAETQEEVLIARGGVPVVRMTPVSASSGVRLGLLEGIVPAKSIPDFTEPLSQEELRQWGEAP